MAVSPAGFPLSAPVWREVTSAGVRLYLVELEPRALGLCVRRGTDPTRAPKITARQALALRADAAAVLDGPMFYDTGSTSRFRFRLLDRGAGVDVPSTEPTAGQTLAVDAAGAVTIVDGGREPAGSVVAIQCYPTLAKDGARAAVGDTESNRSRVWRAALALLESGAVGLVVGIAALRTFAEALAALRVQWAGYTDGGSSTDLRLRSGRRVGFTGEPKVPAWICARGPSSGGAGGSTGAALVFLGAGLGLAAWYLTRDSIA